MVELEVLTKDKKKTNITIIILISIVVPTLLFIIAFALNNSYVQQALVDYERMPTVMALMIFRIIVLGLTAAYLYGSWMKAERIIYDDAKFLFCLFFLVLTFGKTFDLFWSLTYYYYTDELTLLLLRVRYSIIALTLAPMLYFGIYMLMYNRRINRKLSTDHKELARKRNYIMMGILFVMFLSVIILPTQDSLTTALPIMVIPSLLLIVFVFYKAYRYKVLSEINPLVLTIGFSLYLVSNVLRAVLNLVLADKAIYTVITELIDLVVFLVIFVGFIKGIDYS